MSEETSPPTREPLKPHKYPLWIVFPALAVVGLLIYSFILMPKYVSACRSLKDANIAFAKRDFSLAIVSYQNTLKIDPSSKAARLGAAETIFANGNPSDDEDGLTLLENVTLEKSDWKRIQKVLPAQLEQYFKETKTR